VYPEDHEVFGMIVEIRAQWESALASFEEMTAEDPDATSAASDEDW
jgi:hypothetical protein